MDSTAVEQGYVSLFKIIQFNLISQNARLKSSGENRQQSSLVKNNDKEVLHS